jgi:hypothetical protein
MQQVQPTQQLLQQLALQAPLLPQLQPQHLLLVQQHLLQVLQHPMTSLMTVT